MENLNSLDAIWTVGPLVAANDNFVCEAVSICLKCNGTFVVKINGKGRARFKKYCSEKCKDGRKRVLCERTKTCKHCFTEFKTTSNAKKYCSVGCSLRGRNSIVRQSNCLECGSEFSTSDSKQIYCGLLCRVKANSKTDKRIGKVCRTCGIDFLGLHGTKNCSIECSTKAQSIFHASRTAIADSKWARTCRQCGCEFRVGKLSSAQIRGDVSYGIYCSRKCSHEGRRIYADKAEAKLAELARMRALRGTPEQTECVVCCVSFVPKSRSSKVCSDTCRKVHARNTARLSNIANDNIDRSPRPCKECGISFVPQYGSKRKEFCSNKHANKYARRVGKATRRARLKGANYINFDPVSVLERDGWRCYICGIDTPRILRGTLEDNAPELEHLIALANGGDHTPDNTACACRKCNGLKSDNDNYVAETVMLSVA